MIPTVDNNHQAEARALLTSLFQGKPNIQALLDAFTKQIQLAENAAWTLINGIILDNAVGVTLDKWGKIVGESRNGMADNDYRQAIRLRIRVNLSQGRAEDIVQIAILALPPGEKILYQEDYPASWEVIALNIPGGMPRIAQMLGEAKAVGTYGSFTYSIWDPVNDFKFSSVYGDTPGFVPRGFGSVYDPGYVSLMEAASACVPV